MMANSLLKWLSKRGVYVQGYADDGVVLVIGIVLSTVCEIMQRAVKGIEEWCTSHQLAVNPTKTEMVIIHKKVQDRTDETNHFLSTRTYLC